MSCEQFELDLAGRLESGTEPERRSPLGRHLKECAACRSAWREAREGYGALGALPSLAVPEAVSAAVRERIVRELRAGGSAPWRLPSGNVVLASLAGVLGTGASMGLLWPRIDVAAISPGLLVAGSLVWAAAFVAAFALLVQAGSQARSVREIVLCGLGAIGVFLVVDLLLPLTGVVTFCRASPLGQGVIGSIGVETVFFALGSGYAAIPLFLLSFATSGARGREALRRAVFTSGIFFFLVAPAIFLQCHAFTIGALVPWLAGAGLGSLAGSAAGQWFHRRAPVSH